MPLGASVLSDLHILSIIGLPLNLLHRLIQLCTQVVTYFGQHPGETKLGQNQLPGPDRDMSNSSWSFLNLGPGGIYVFLTMLGQGQFARVKYALRIDAAASDPEANQLWVVKIQSSESSGKWSKYYLTPEQIQTEASIGLRMGFFSHPLLTRKFSEKKHKHYLIGPYQGVNLEQWLITKPGVQQRLTVAIRICLMLDDMHENKRVLHRDIKSVNILVDPVHLTIRLADFGFSLALDAMPSNPTVCGTPYYLPLTHLRNMENAEQIAPILGWMSDSEGLRKFDIFALRRVLVMPELNLPKLPSSLLDQSMLSS